MLSVVCCMYKKDQNVSRTIELSARPVMAVKRPHPANKMQFFCFQFFWTISNITFTQLNHQGSAVWSNGRQLTPPTNTISNQNSQKGKYQRLTVYTVLIGNRAWLNNSIPICATNTMRNQNSKKAHTVLPQTNRIHSKIIKLKLDSKIPFWYVQHSLMISILKIQMIFSKYILLLCIRLTLPWNCTHLKFDTIPVVVAHTADALNKWLCRRVCKPASQKEKYTH